MRGRPAWPARPPDPIRRSGAHGRRDSALWIAGLLPPYPPEGEPKIRGSSERPRQLLQRGRLTKSSSEPVVHTPFSSHSLPKPQRRLALLSRSVTVAQ